MNQAQYQKFWKNFVPLSLLTGLLDGDADFETAAEELIRTFQNFSNALPRNIFGGKSPREKSTQMNERGEEERDIVINTIPIGNGQWNDEYRKENGTNSAGTTLAPAAQSAKTGRRQNGSIATENSNSSKNHYFTGHPSRLTLLYY